MAKASQQQRLTPSVLDRLLDDAPEMQSEPATSRSQVLRELKIAVRRDLENLLNTRRRFREWPEELTELNKSLVHVGIPDFTSGNMGSAAAREECRRTVEEAIRTYEPRFKAVEVQLPENVESLDRTLRLRIVGTLYAEPAPEPVVFDSVVEPTSGAFEIRAIG